MATFTQKLSISAGSAVLFALVNLPFTYGLTDSIPGLDTYDKDTKCPTSIGLLIHAMLFFVVTYLTMGNPSENIGIKMRYTIYGTLIFYLLSSPAVYSLTSSVFGRGIASSEGCPGTQGVILHALVYCMALVGVMYLPETGKLN